MWKRYFAIFVAYLAILTSAQQNNVHEFKTVTWNSDGAKWDSVKTLMNTGLDILAVQEAGSITAISRQLQDTVNPLPFYFSDCDDLRAADMGVKEYNWNAGSTSYYLYYYTIRLNVQVPGAQRRTTKQNMAIVTKTRAAEIILISPEVRHDSAQNDMHAESCRERTFINRPALGIRIANSVFFSVHPEPIRTYNEAPVLLREIRNYVEGYRAGRTMTWMAMGDFNRNPNQLTPDLPAASNGQFIRIVNSNSPTHRHKTKGTTDELDYSVVGGPLNYLASASAIRVRIIPPQSSASDHQPVGFN